MRALNYNIPYADRSEVKKIAGRIIPALITTTAVVAGFVCIELLKLLQGREALSDYRNLGVNLAVNFFDQMEPSAAQLNKITDKLSTTFWDVIKVEVEADSSMRSLIAHFKVILFF
jgi:ubiquitin-activating enzyme E1